MMERVTRFPNRLYHAIWRNWDIVSASRLARMLSTSVRNVRLLARDLGLGAQPGNLARHHDRLRSLIIRRNWHILSRSQIGDLVGMNQEELSRFMRVTDFLELNLPPKPRCANLQYRPPGAASRRAAQRLAEITGKAAKPKQSEDAFTFLDSLHKGIGDFSPLTVKHKAKWALAPRIMHPYDTPHNESGLLSANTPLKYLKMLKKFGADGLWFPIVLFDIIRVPGFPDMGKQRSAIMPRLRTLIRRAERAGLGIYLYLCEPRAQTKSFFRSHPSLCGAQSRVNPELYHLCTSTEEARDLVRRSFENLCRALPGLAGIISITASEYPTHCWSHGLGTDCPRCTNRRPSIVLAETLKCMQQGIADSGKNAELIAWNWGWQWALKRRPGCKEPDITRLDLAPDARTDVFQRLPERVTPLLNFEYGHASRLGGVTNHVWEYSMSRPQQGPYTAVQKQSLDRLGRSALARIQISNSTEFLGAPYIPIMHSVAEKIEAVRAAGYDGFMGSWIFGGYPSPNLLIARELSRDKTASASKALHQVATLLYGSRQASLVLEAWEIFSRAFKKYPQSIPLQYASPIHIAPAVPWPLEPTGSVPLTYNPSDDCKRYCYPYAPARVADIFEKIAREWNKGLASLGKALKNAPANRRRRAQRDYAVAETFYLCCRSLANHIRFCEQRPHYRRNAAARAELLTLVANEQDLAKRYYQLINTDSRIGFEASVQYFARPNDVLEKIAGLHQLENVLQKGTPND